MKKVILGLALAAMIISCKKETTVEKTEEVTEVPAAEPVEVVPDTVVSKTETVDTVHSMGGDKTVKTTVKTVKEVK